MTTLKTCTQHAHLEIELQLRERGARWLATEPERKSIGVVRLAGWQIQSAAGIAALPQGQDCYLVKVNYELVQDGCAADIQWFETSFAFPETVKVIDAIPHTTAPNEGGSYLVNRYANLVPCSGDVPDAHLPEQDSAVSTFGVGTSTVRWQHHRANRRHVGSRVAWIVLAVPSELTCLPVEATSRFSTDVDDVDTQPVALPARFGIDLKHALSPRPEPLIPTVDARCAAWPWSPRIFISYAHDSPQHVTQVRSLADFLLNQGFDIHIDYLDCTERRDWSLWAQGQFRSADYVIVVASPRCAAVGDGTIQGTDHMGMQSEMALLRDLVHRHRQEWTRRILPVVLPGSTPDDIPCFLQPHTADHYIVSDFTPDGAADLLSVLRHNPHAADSSCHDESGVA